MKVLPSKMFEVCKYFLMCLLLSAYKVRQCTLAEKLPLTMYALYYLLNAFLLQVFRIKQTTNWTAFNTLFPASTDVYL